MPRLYKDLIVEENDRKARVNLINRDGTVALHEVYAELASPVMQQGDAWGAREANLLMQLGDDGVPQLKLEGYYKAPQVDALVGARAPASHGHAAAAVGAGALGGNVTAINTNRAASCLRNIYVNGAATNYILMVRK